VSIFLEQLDSDKKGYNRHFNFLSPSIEIKKANPYAFDVTKYPVKYPMEKHNCGAQY